jgi:hypothetical protein
MNIFVLDSDPVKAAEYQCDKHVVKMILETAQMLCTAIHETGGNAHYKSTHRNHPCTIWARKSKGNFAWLKTHGLALCKEYNKRYGKVHKSQAVIEECLDLTIPDGCKTNFALAMPDYCKVDNVVDSYRNYYLKEKSNIAKWKLGNKPDWFLIE